MENNSIAQHTEKFDSSSQRKKKFSHKSKLSLFLLLSSAEFIDRLMLKGVHEWPGLCPNLHISRSTLLSSCSPANTVPDRAMQRYFWFLNPYQQCNPDKSEPQQFHFISDHSQAFRKRKIFRDYPFPYCMNATKCNEHEKQASK